VPSTRKTPRRRSNGKETHTAAKSSNPGKTSGKAWKTSAKRRKGLHTKTAQSWRSRQLAPTPERYKQIQSALAERGYLKDAPNGVWDAQSADALKHFQQEQNLEPSGRVNSLSLIALGLGAKHGTAPASNPAQAPPPPNPVPNPPAVEPPLPGERH
jgi:peptidoglycan hydrolase-like protein with peptidoglycan-binding domain